MKGKGRTRGVPPLFFVRVAAKGLSSPETRGCASVDSKGASSIERGRGAGIDSKGVSRGRSEAFEMIIAQITSPIVTHIVS